MAKRARTTTPAGPTGPTWTEADDDEHLQRMFGAPDGLGIPSGRQAGDADRERLQRARGLMISMRARLPAIEVGPKTFAGRGPARRQRTPAEELALDQIGWRPVGKEERAIADTARRLARLIRNQSPRTKAHVAGGHRRFAALKSDTAVEPDDFLELLRAQLGIGSQVSHPEVDADGNHPRGREVADQLLNEVLFQNIERFNWDIALKLDQLAMLYAASAGAIPANAKGRRIRTDLEINAKEWVAEQAWSVLEAVAPDWLDAPHHIRCYAFAGRALRWCRRDGEPGSSDESVRDHWKGACKRRASIRLQPPGAGATSAEPRGG